MTRNLRDRVSKLEATKPPAPQETLSAEEADAIVFLIEWERTPEADRRPLTPTEQRMRAIVARLQESC